VLHRARDLRAAAAPVAVAIAAAVAVAVAANATAADTLQSSVCPLAPPVMPLSLADLNAAAPDEFVALLAGIYEHSPWVVEGALPQRPFASLAALKRALVETVRGAGRERQLALLRAHPELAGKAMVARTLTAESTREQGRAGLADCTPAEFERLQELNRQYNEKFTSSSPSACATCTAWPSCVWPTGSACSRSRATRCWIWPPGWRATATPSSPSAASSPSPT